MSDSEDDGAGTALPRQKSIFSTMGRVRNMNQLREKWTARGKLSSSSGVSELEASASAPGVSPHVASGHQKKRAAHSVTAATASTVSPVASSATRTPIANMTPLEAQRFAVLSTWMQRSGLVVPLASEGDAFDSLYASLDEMEAAVKRDLAVLWPPQWPSPMETETMLPPGPRASSLVDYMVVIGPDMADLSTRTYWLGQENVFEATVVFAHPPHSQFNAECIEQFCFPRGVLTSSALEPDAADEFFVLVLSGGGDQGQSVQYACCLRKHIVISGSTATSSCLVPVCYAVVVSVPWIPFYHQLLRHLAARHQEDLWTLKSEDVQCSVVPDTLAQHIDSIMSALRGTEPPARGQELRFSWSPNVTFACVRPRIDCGAPETVTLLLDWAMRQLLSVLSIERMIMVIGLLLVEMKIIVVAKSMPLLSAGTLGLAALLNPLAWAGPLICILPPALHEYLEAPVPLLCGVDVLPDHFVLTKGTAVLDMEKDEIQLHPDDAAQVGALQFPGSEGLSRQLRSFSDRILSLNNGDQSGVVVANFVVRRIRRQLQDLLLLCARVNPCNAYACMKQEQLSLSETLFLKSFMQSQMYQKYSDDQAPNQVPAANNKHDPLPQGCGNLDVLCPATPVTASLAPSIRELFMVAVTGSCLDDDLVPSSSKRNDSITKEADGETHREEVTQEDYTEELSTKSTRSSNSSSMNSSPSDRRRTGSASEGVMVSENRNLPMQTADSHQSVIKVLKISPLAHPVTLHSREGSDTAAPETVHVHDDTKARSTPVSPDKILDNQQPRCLEDVYSSGTRSMPDVLVMSEGATQPDRAATEVLTSAPSASAPSARSASLVLNTDDANRARLGSSRGHKQHAPTHQHHVLVRLKRSMAATQIQSAWRKRELRLRPTSRTVSSRALSLASARSASDTTFPSSASDWTSAELHFGTMLSMHAERGRIIDIRMRLGVNGNDLEWHHGDKARGRIALADVQEVKAHDGNIVIQTSAQGQITFIVPPNGAAGAMAFFQGLHRLATTAHSSSGLPSPATSIGSSDQNFPSPAISRQESVRCDTATQVKEPSTHEGLRRTAVDINTGGSSFLSFDDSMRRGILVLKHGRMGRPHPKFFMCDDAIQVLSWTDPVVTNAGFQPPVATSQQPSRVEKKGIRFEDVTDLVRGKRTRVLQRSTASRSNAELCFSIVTNARTLDIETFSREDFALLVDGIQQRLVARAPSRG